MDLLDERKIKVIEALVEGTAPKTLIAKDNAISRQTIYDWLDDPIFKAEVDRRLQQRKVFVEKKIDGKLNDAVDSLFDLAETTENARVKAQVLQYIIDRGLGKPVAKHELKADMGDLNGVSTDVLEAEFEEWEMGRDGE